jgi:hypothetical protein
VIVVVKIGESVEYILEIMLPYINIVFAQI